MKVPNAPLTPEHQAQRAIQDAGFEVHNANVLFRANCPNIDLVVYGKTSAIYVQVKSSRKPANKDHIIIDGSPWNEVQLRQGADIFNKHDDGFRASLIVIVDNSSEIPAYYVAPPKELLDLVLPKAIEFAARPKLDGSVRSIGFRKELPRADLLPYLNGWDRLGERYKPQTYSLVG
jgi:hypothetical protein